MATSTNRIVDALLARLQGALPAVVAAEGLPAITEFLGYVPAVLQPAKAPQLFIDVVQESRGDLAAFGGENAKQARQREITIAITVAGNDPDTASRRLRSFADLAVAVMEADQALGGEALRVQWLRTDYTPTVADNATALFQAVLLTFQIPRWAVLGED